jgi:NAD(P)-dependent dehydrogenase (short-subunit alcohol dehydrogenase family)
MGQVLVTGARRGIGKAIALALAAADFDVAVSDMVDDGDLTAVAAEIRAKGMKSVAIKADISKLDDHGRMLDAAQSVLGPLTTLINNAGAPVMSRGDLLDVTPESFDRCINVNTRGTFFLTQAFARRVRDVPSHCHRAIINITSTNVDAPSITRGEYCISKAGTSMMTKLFATRLADEDIGVYEIQPGLIETEMTAVVKDRYHAMTQNGGTVIRRLGQPEDVARIAVTIAQGLLPYTVGQAIKVDGGLMLVRY